MGGLYPVIHPGRLIRRVIPSYTPREA